MQSDSKFAVTRSSDADRLAFILNAKASFRTAQQLRTWEQRVAAIARMNAENLVAKHK